MRKIFLLIATGVSTGFALLGQSPALSEFARIAATDAANVAAANGGPRTGVSMWIWSDKYVYRPGQQLTLRWTVKANDDKYPYTLLAYRQNNQNGRKFYLPGGAEAATDLLGNTVSAGFQALQAGNVTKGVLAANLTVPDEPGMHTIVVQLRDYTGLRVLKSAYMKIGVVKEEVTLEGEITSDRLLTNDKQWNLKGVVTVKNNARLTIEPGTFVIGQPGSQPPSLLLVTRNGSIVANGTKSRPIVMTSSQPFGQRKRGDWGGLILLGKAPINVGAGAGGNSNQAGSFFIEGLAATEDGAYGGNDPNHFCGALSYVRVEYAGSILSPNNETNSFTWGGCGESTKAEHLQAIYGQDDSFEWFGGNMNAKYLVGGLGADDYVDFQLGYTGKIQYGIFYQSPDDRGNRGIEGDNSEYNQAAEPFSNPFMFNMTFVGSGQPGFDETNSPGIFLRRGARGSFNNMVVTNFYTSAVDISDAATQAQADAGNVTMNGIMMFNNGIGRNAANTVESQVTAGFTVQYATGARGSSGGRPAGQNFVAEDPLLAKPFEFSDPDFAGRFGSPTFRAGFIAPPDDGFFDQSAQFIGGIGDEDWTDEWTSWLVESDLAL